MFPKDGVIIVVEINLITQLWISGAELCLESTKSEVQGKKYKVQI